MKRFYNCIRISILFFVLFGFQDKIYSQADALSDTKLLDTLLASKDFKKADSVLTYNISNLKDKQAYLELTKRIYYFGKIALNLNDKNLAIKKTHEFAESITQATDSLEVSRQKYLILARFYVYLRDFKLAAEQNIKALEITDKMPNATGDLYGLIHHNLSLDYRRAGNIKKATWHSKKSLDYYLSYPKSDKSKVLDAYNSLGGRMWDVYKIDSALYYFKKGEEIIEELQPTPMNKYYHMAKSQSNISSVYSIMGNSSNARLYNEKAIKNYTNFIKSDTDKDFFKEEAQLFLLMTIENYAADYADQGNYTKSRDLHHYVLDKKLNALDKDDSEIAYTSMQLGNTYIKLKDYKTAESYIDNGLEIYTNAKQKNYLGIADAYYYKGLVEDFYNNTEKAKLYYEKSQSYYKDVFGENYDRFYLDAMITYSSFYSRNGFTEKAIEMATNAYQYLSSNQGEKTTLESSQLLNIADIYYNSKNYSEGLKYANNAIELIDKTSEYNNVSITNLKKPTALMIKSKLELELNKDKSIEFLEEQFNNLKEAITSLENQKAIVTADENISIILADNDEVFELAKQVTMMLYNKTNDSQYLKEALSIHESKLYNRIRQQLNIKSQFKIQDIPKSILDQEEEIKDQLNSSIKIDTNLESYIKANKDWEAFLKKLKEDYPKYYGLKYASIKQSLNLNEINLGNTTTIVRYMFIDKALFVFIIDNNTFKSYRLDENKASEILTLNTLSQNDYNTSNFKYNHKLYEILWQPFANDITNNNIIIIPDDELFNLSFETLTTTKTNSNEELAKHSLLNKYSISYNYSLLLVDKNKSPKFFNDNFVAFTPEFNDNMKANYVTAIKDSVFLDKTYLTLLPQPFTLDLAKEYSRLFNGSSFVNEKASKQIFTAEANEHKIIHIGTHAESNNVSPELSRLIFAKDLNDDTITNDNSLYTYEIYNQNLSSNLAILTACETGKPTFQAGEGMISLAHAFNYAGSESILTSLWKIDEQSSAKIIENFYDHLKNGLPKDKALQKAKLDYIANAEGRTISPQYWAGLVLIGDTAPIDISSSNNWWIWLLLSILLIGMIVLFRKR